MPKKKSSLDLIARVSERLSEDASGTSEAIVSEPDSLNDPSPPLNNEKSLPPESGENSKATWTDIERFDLDLVALQKQGFVTPNHQRSLIAEEFRIVKRPLLQNAFKKDSNSVAHNHVVMVTSAKPDEGKTFTSINLAMSVASERDLYVLLIDADIRRAGVGEQLGVKDRKGLMDVLVEPDLHVSDVLVRTNIPNLSILPAGIPRENATELFASKSMTDLVDDIAARYQDRFIIFDTPPVLASSEPSVLALHVGQVVMVVHANLTSRKAIAQSLPLLSGCPNINCIINNLSLAGTDRFGYYSTYG